MRMPYTVPPEIRAWASDARKYAAEYAQRLRPGDDTESAHERECIAAASVDGAVLALTCSETILVPVIP